MVDAPTLAQRFSDHFKRGRQAPYQLCEYWVGVDGETGELGAEWADKPHRLVFDLLHHAVFQENEIENLRRQIAELRGECDAQLAETQRAWNERDGEKRRAIAAEKQNEELVRERDAHLHQARYLDKCADKYLAALKRAEAAEAENARLRALPLKEVGPEVIPAGVSGNIFDNDYARDIMHIQPVAPLSLKDERHLTLDEQKTFDDALRNSGTVRQVLPLKDEVERVLNESRRHVSENLIRMYGHDEFGEIRRIDALLSRLRAGEQEGWRSMESAPKDGTRILVCRKRPKSGSMSKNPAIGSWNGLREGGARPGWVLEIKTNTYLVSNDELLGWQPLPAAPSEHGGDDNA